MYRKLERLKREMKVVEPRLLKGMGAWRRVQETWVCKGDHEHVHDHLMYHGVKVFSKHMVKRRICSVVERTEFLI